MKCALYCRVSTSDQNNELQVSELKRFALAHGWEIVNVYQETMSGAKRDRPQLIALMEHARLRYFDVVLVWKLDRFGRSTTDLANNLRELERLKVRFIATSQGLDTDQSNPVSRFLMQVLSAVAELEREMICERVRAGQERAKAKGVKFGRRQVVYNRTHAIEMHEDGASIRQIAKTLEIGVGTVHRLVASVPKVPLERLTATGCNGTGNRLSVKRSKG